MQRILPFTRAVPVLLLLLTGCSGAKGEANAAIAAADQALAGLGPDAAKVLPFDVQQLTDAVAAARDTLAKGDPVAALAAVADLPTRATELGSRVAAKRDQLKAELDTLGFAMTRNLAGIQAKVDEFDRTKRLPKGLDAAGLAKVKEALASATQEWEQIKSEIQGGELASAFGKGTALRLKVSETLMAVGLVADDPAWHNLTLPPS